MRWRHWLFAGSAAILACMAVLVWRGQESVEAYWIEEKEIAGPAKEQLAQNVEKGKTQQPENGSVQEAVFQSLMKLEQAQSVQSDLVMDMDVKVFGFPMEFSAAMDMTAFRDPLKIKSDMEMDLGLLGDTQMQVYAGEQNGKYRLYVKESDGWKISEVEAKDLGRYDGLSMMKTYIEQTSELTAAGTDELPGGEAMKYTGVVHGEGLEKVLFESGSMKLFAGLLKQNMLKPLGNKLEQEEEKLPGLLKNAEDMKVTLWIDKKTGYPVQCSVDITDMLSEALTLIQEEAADGKEGTDLTSQIRLTGTTITVRCSDFNEAEDFVIPKEALNGKVVSIEK